MKKKIAILGSTGSIGKSLLKILSKQNKNIEIKLLTGNKNYRLLLKQAKKFNVKNIIVTDKKYYELALLKKDKRIKIYNNFEELNKIFSSKIDYVMSSIVGIQGMIPTIKIIKYTKNITIANKEAIICAWSLIKKKLKLHKTNFIPVDSEHFSVWHALNKSFKTDSVKKIYLTASGGPLLNTPKSKLKKLSISNVLKHPNWRMGKKISVDSSTMMNKVFEIIEAKKIFNIDYNKLDILIHPNSYIHAIVQFQNNMISIIAHHTTMDIPIFNSFYKNNELNLNKNLYNLDLKKLNNASFQKVDTDKFPLVKILNDIPKKESLYETVLVAANDELVNYYLKKKIQYSDIIIKLMKIIKLSSIKKMKEKYPKNLNDILKVNNYTRSKIKMMLGK